METFRSYGCFKISDKEKLSNIFREMEENKEKYHLMNYSIKQISLEQIFMNFANKIDRDEID